MEDFGRLKQIISASDGGNGLVDILKKFDESVKFGNIKEGGEILFRLTLQINL